jgi:hypothetical protein
MCFALIATPSNFWFPYRFVPYCFPLADRFLSAISVVSCLFSTSFPYGFALHCHPDSIAYLGGIACKRSPYGSAARCSMLVLL